MNAIERLILAQDPAFKAAEVWANKMRGKASMVGLDWSDLFAAGAAAVSRAIYHFEEGQGCSLETFASRYAEKEVKNYIRSLARYHSKHASDCLFSSTSEDGEGVVESAADESPNVEAAIGAKDQIKHARTLRSLFMNSLTPRDRMAFALYVNPKPGVEPVSLEELAALQVKAKVLRKGAQGTKSGAGAQCAKLAATWESYLNSACEAHKLAEASHARLAARAARISRRRNAAAVMPAPPKAPAAPMAPASAVL